MRDTGSIWQPELQTCRLPEKLQHECTRFDLNCFNFPRSVFVCKDWPNHSHQRGEVQKTQNRHTQSRLQCATCHVQKGHSKKLPHCEAWELRFWFVPSGRLQASLFLLRRGSSRLLSLLLLLLLLSLFFLVLRRTFRSSKKKKKKQEYANKNTLSQHRGWAVNDAEVAGWGLFFRPRRKLHVHDSTRPLALFARPKKK